MFLGYQQVAAGALVQTAAAFAIPPRSTMVELQASFEEVRYTMDGVTNPTATTGMVLFPWWTPTMFLLEDFRRIRFCQGVPPGGFLNAHFAAGRDV